MKTKGRRQSTNVREVHPTDAYQRSGTYRQGLWRKLDQEDRKAMDDNRPLPKAVDKAAKRIEDDSRIKRSAASRGSRIKTGKRKGPRP